MNISKKQKTVEKFMKNMILLVAILLIASNLVAFDDWQTGEHGGTPGLEFQRIGVTDNVEVRRGSADATHMIIPQTVQLAI